MEQESKLLDQIFSVLWRDGYRTRPGMPAVDSPSIENSKQAILEAIDRAQPKRHRGFLEMDTRDYLVRSQAIDEYTDNLRSEFGLDVREQ